jgi:hypothetical protein
MGEGQYDAGDAVQVKTRKGKVKLKRENDLAALRLIVSTRLGRRFMWRLLSECKIYSESFAGEAAHMTSYNEGKRHVGLWALTEICEAEPEAYALMRREAQETEANG